MALVLKDRVQETATANTTVSFTLTGAVAGYQSFSTIGNTNTVYYAATDTSNNWEVGTGTWATGGTLTRTTILSSSNAGSAVTFVGTVNVFADYPAGKAVYQDALGTVTVPQLATNSTTSTTPTLSFNGSNTNLASGATVSGSYLQSILQNKSGTAGASTNYVLSNDLGTDSTYYGEFGMNSSVYSSGTPSDYFSLNNGIYYSGHDGDVSIGSGNGYKTYFAWGTVGQSAHVINATGAIGLNTNITGTTNFGTAGQVLTSAGSSATPTWTSVTTTPGGSTTQVQYNNAGVLAGSANFTFDGTNLYLGQTYNQGTGIVQATGNATVNGNLIDKNLYLQGGNNLLIFSEQFDNAAWTKTNGTVTANAAVAPNGTTTADSFTASIADWCRVLQFITTANTIYTLSCYMKAGTNSGYLSLGVANVYVKFNLTNGTFILGSAATSATITDVGNGWYRCTATLTSASSGIALLGTWEVGSSDSFNQPKSTAGGTVNIWGAQLELGAVASGYTPTTTVAITTTNNISVPSGTITTSSDATFNTVKVGLGGGAVATNTAVGYQAINATATGTNNTGIGYSALTSVLAGTLNTAVGRSALQNTTSASSNSAVGTQALNFNTTGGSSSALGYQSLFYNISGGNLVAVGQQALFNNTTASNLTAVGYQSLYNNTTNIATLGSITGGSGYTTGTYTGVVMTLSSGSTATTYPTATIVVAGGAVTTVTITSAGIGFKDTTTVLTAPAASIGGTGSGFSVPVATLASGTGNTAVGYQSLLANTTGNNITAIGYSALSAHTTGTYNTAVGVNSLISTTTTSYNTGVGHQALSSSNALGNTGVGANTGRAVTSGANNTFLGYAAGYSGTNDLTTGSNNIIVGYNAAASAAGVSNEITLGNSSITSMRVPGIAATFGTSNSTISTLTVGLGGGANAFNTVLGFAATQTNSSGTNLVAIGYNSLQANTTAGNNVGVGRNTLYSTTTGGGNVAVGTSASFYNVTGTLNTALGYNSLYNNTTASNLTAVGYQALFNNTTNVATLGTITGGTGYTDGTYTGVVMTLSSGSTATTYPTATIVVSGGAVTSVTITSGGVGFKDTTTVLTAPSASIGGTGSGFSVPVATLKSGTANNALGYQAGFGNTTGTDNTALGYRVIYTNTTGFGLTATGNYALFNNTTGNYSSANGYYALFSNTTGNNNVALGTQAGYGNASANANTTGVNNTYIGYQTVGSANNNTNEMVIGNQAIGLGSNTTVIGNSSTTLTKTFGVYQATTYTVATLPSASTVGVGARAFVTDALTPTFGATVVTGGAIAVPVYSDGTNWKVG